MDGQELDLQLAGGPSPGHLSEAVAQRTAPRLQRAAGLARASVGPVGARTALRRLHQAGCAKLRFPRASGPGMEAVLVNTAGGLTGGDRIDVELDVEAGAALTLTSQACERVYRSLGGAAQVLARLQAGEGAALAWLPQETILFDGGAIARSLEVEAAASSRLLLCESVILGRQAMGESVRDGLFRDRWRVRRGGRLVFADDLRLEGDIARIAAEPALLGGARAFATVLYQGEAPEDRLASARRILGEAGGASLVDGFVVARLAVADGLALRRRLVPLLGALASGPLPRIWSM
ncbi:urease accessory protein UreD [Antarcticirhabdus aurantiaca]|uniref:Urease accessory protein UreD n=1 Tax=Antarcticirhabdus aurantiaca TaxID=2606717 RepID=A0ACD4NJ33_9HYPH|nr:urease accessory protein UreD [Antarcticirhabdus aurantiaca]WAJ26777.1 urease accessory protein UreD [Jeongeuplla avenae]